MGLSDQFVAEAETGGLITLALFIAILSQSFSRLDKGQSGQNRTSNGYAGALVPSCSPTSLRTLEYLIGVNLRSGGTRFWP